MDEILRFIEEREDLYWKMAQEMEDNKTKDKFLLVQSELMRIINKINETNNKQNKSTE